MTLLRCEGLSLRLLRDVDLAVSDGERLGVVGESGAGKTTLLRALLALEQPDAGTVTCRGRQVRPGSPRRLGWFRRLVQYVPQDPASTLDPRRSVRELVALPVQRLGTPDEGRRMRGLVDEALDAVDLPGSLRDARAPQLSGGQAQRVALARALVLRPALLLADEPVSGLDLPLRAQVLASLRAAFERQGTSLLLVSHDLAAVAALCHRTVVLADGRAVEDVPTRQLLRAPQHPSSRALVTAVPTLP
ncbi:ABC transporter ATP-binding protein [Motilibacter deserti]|uniref:ATP-binding cassette domain-containing protein n=1 Tax=Motilibacter deserti TaxID=2714956 RepID=A0ABX0GYD1_9ACTN|nr:ATP-binding cassette domain-containing protein [Motilibacter deserti]